jgi:hypothetical protein
MCQAAKRARKDRRRCHQHPDRPHEPDHRDPEQQPEDHRMDLIVVLAALRHGHLLRSSRRMTPSPCRTDPETD